MVNEQKLMNTECLCHLNFDVSRVRLVNIPALMATSTCQFGFINSAAAVSADLEQPLKIASGTQKGAALNGLHAAKGLLHMGWHNMAAAALQYTNQFCRWDGFLHSQEKTMSCTSTHKLLLIIHCCLPGRSRGQVAATVGG